MAEGADLCRRWDRVEGHDDNDFLVLVVLVRPAGGRKAGHDVESSRWEFHETRAG